MKKTPTNQHTTEEQNSRVEVADSEKEKEKDTTDTDKESLNLNFLLSAIEIGEAIGQGGFATIYKAKYQGQEVAVKSLSLQNYNTSAVEGLKKEAEIMQTIGHSDFVVKLIGVCPGPFPYIVMEYMPQGDLFHLLSSPKELSWNQRYIYASDIAKGLNCLHQQGIFYRDLKSHNVLITGEHAKLCDFGLALTSTMTFKPEMAAGSVHWRAPETFKIDDQLPAYTNKSDIYSLGITFFEIAARKLPYEGCNIYHIQTIVVREKGRPKIPREVPRKFSELMQWCWKHEPQERPETEEVIKTLNIF